MLWHDFACSLGTPILGPLVSAALVPIALATVALALAVLGPVALAPTALFSVALFLATLSLAARIPIASAPAASTRRDRPPGARLSAPSDTRCGAAAPVGLASSARPIASLSLHAEVGRRASSLRFRCIPKQRNSSLS